MKKKFLFILLILYLTPSISQEINSEIKNKEDGANIQLQDIRKLIHYLSKSVLELRNEIKVLKVNFEMKNKKVTSGKIILYKLIQEIGLDHDSIKYIHGFPYIEKKDTIIETNLYNNILELSNNKLPPTKIKCPFVPKYGLQAKINHVDEFYFFSDECNSIRKYSENFFQTNEVIPDIDKVMKLLIKSFDDE